MRFSIRLAFTLLLGLAFPLFASEPTIRLTNIRDIAGTNSSDLGGAAETQLERVAFADYPDDGSGEQIWQSPSLPNPREISNIVSAQLDSMPNRDNLSDMTWAWGQFVDHDIDLTHTSVDNGDANVWVESQSDLLWPIIPMDRSDYERSGEGSPRQQINSITAFIDASNVYGSDIDRANALRTFEAGRLKMGPRRLLPLNEDGLPNAGGNGADLFVAGDIRANEQIGLTCMHTLFVREHNRLARRISKTYPNSSDEEIYQLARKIVGAEMQIITYKEFLPALLGRQAPSLREYRGFQPDVNPSIANEFSTSLYRFGHSMLSPHLARTEGKRELSPLPLRDAFFNPEILLNGPANLDHLLAGLCTQRAQEIDAFVVDDVRNFLFGSPGEGGLDLATLNIQRGRDHGIPRYNDVRIAYGLPPVNSFAEISSDPYVQAALEIAYQDVERIDAWVGAISEEHLPDASVGLLLTVALRDQFERLRDGDRFFYLNDRDLRSRHLKSIINLNSVSLASILRFNTNVKLTSNDLFHVRNPKQRPRRR